MHRIVGLAAAVLAVSLLGCSSGDAITIEVLYPASQYGEQTLDSIPFRISGADIGDTILCESGTMNQDRLESPEGEIITSEEGGELYEAARANRGAMDSYRVQEFVCDDGTGTFVLKIHARVDFDKPANDQDTSTWVVESGTGDYTDLSGSGEVPMDLGGAIPNEMDELVAAYVGEVQTG